MALYGQCQAGTKIISLKVGVASIMISSMGNVTLGKRFCLVHRWSPEDCRRQEKVNGRNSARDN